MNSALSRFRTSWTTNAQGVTCARGAGLTYLVWQQHDGWHWARTDGQAHGGPYNGQTVAMERAERHFLRSLPS